VKGFPGYAQIRRIAIVPERWTVENGLLTPTLKLKRDPIVAKHQDLIDQIYKGH
jgi:long-chain acyl-CoA synthetase